jgi:hypothetical protein
VLGDDDRYRGGLKLAKKRSLGMIRRVATDWGADDRPGRPELVAGP